MDKHKFTTIDEYHASVTPPVRELLEQMRATIREAAPKAKEVISYNMPAFKADGILVYYAAAKEHIGLYPTASPIQVFSKELEGYQTSKGAIQFPFAKGIPKNLVKKIVRYRMVEDEEHAKEKALKKKQKKGS